MSYEETGRKIGAIVDQKNEAYGDSFAKCPQYLKILYPDGIKPDQYQDALALIRDFDKSMRIATNRDAMGENPWSDKAGYAILSVGKGEVEHSQHFYDKMGDV
jgi:hypothetical protein